MRITPTAAMREVADFFAEMRRLPVKPDDPCGLGFCAHPREFHATGTCSLCPIDAGKSRHEHAFAEPARAIAPDEPRALVYYVGGCVRDLLTGREPKDIDLATDATPVEIEVFAASRGRKVITVGRQFGTVKVSVPVAGRSVMVELTTFRGETYNGDSRKPAVTWGRTIVDDLGRRDFTLNAIAARPDGSLIDPHGGADDIANRMLRAVSSQSGGPRVRFHEDPLRILRGIRFAARYGLEIEPRTAEKMDHCRWEILRLSKERITEEIDKLFNLREAGAVHRGLELLFRYRVWQMVCPPLQRQFGFEQGNPHHVFPLHEHSIRVAVAAIAEEHRLHDEQKMESCRFECVARSGWSGLLHDVAKPDVKEIHKSGTRYNFIGHDILGADIVDGWARQQRWSTSRREFVVNTIRHHLEDACWLRPFDQAGKGIADV